MSKPMFVISAAVDTYSGYGARSRDLVKAIIETDKYDVKIAPQMWGNTPWGFIEDNPEWSFLKDHFLTTPQLPKQPEIWMQITVPNEFQRVGKFNIGVTAGIETTLSPGDWIEGINRMDLTLTSSEHSKQTFINTVLSKVDQRTNQQIGEVKVEKPLEVLFEGANTDVYKPITKEDIKNINLSDVKESFAYLFVGHWMHGEVGEDRKNVGLLIKAFYEVFKNKKNKPALILKTSQVGSSYMDRDEILKKINFIKNTVNSTDLPNIYLLHGEFSDSEMNELYNHPKVKAMVSLTKGEGFGRPLLEFSLTKKPILTTGWSGHIDFLKPNMSTLLPGTLTNVHPSTANTMLLKESQWFSVDMAQLGLYLKDIFENHKNYTEKAKMQSSYSKNNFSYNKMKDKVDEIFTKYIPEFPKAVELKLPQLKKIELPKLKKIEENVG
jgi:glycosyltransferase involved in cell wall biosynthesis